MPRLTFLLTGLAVMGCVETASLPADPTAAIDSMLTASAAAWNRGDLDGFMSTYVDDSSTTFLTASGLGEGYEWIRNRYAPRFEPGAARDSLRFTELRVRPLGRDHALATARYVLFRRDSTTATGPFTVVLRRTEQGWKMIHDHTS